MSIRRIKAHYAIEEGDIVKIINKPNRLIYLFFAVLLAMFVVVTFLSTAAGAIQLMFFITIIVIGFLSGSSGIERKVPRADVVEIKRYHWPPRVTVVLDDERARMARMPPPKPTT